MFTGGFIHILETLPEPKDLSSSICAYAVYSISSESLLYSR